MRTETLSLSGYFWLPGAANKSVPGTITITDGGEIRLELWGTFDTQLSDFQLVFQIPRILGVVEKHDAVTLDNCVYEQKQMPLGSLVKSKLLITTAVLGGSFENDPVAFDSFAFSVEGLDEWLTKSGIKVERGLPGSAATIVYNPPSETILWTRGDLTLIAAPTWTLPGFPLLTQATIKQRMYFRLKAAHPKPFAEFAETAHKITNFLCFAVDETLAIREVEGRHSRFEVPMANGQTINRPLKIYYQSLSFSEVVPTIHWHKMLFRLPQIESKSQSVIDAWMNAYERILPAMSLYFSSRTGEYRYLNGRFLALAQALETYHRRSSTEQLMPSNEFKLLLWCVLDSFPAFKDYLSKRLQFANELSLADRLGRMLKPFEAYFGAGKQQKVLIRSIVDTRNYFTHYPKELEEKASDGHDLWRLCLKMEALFQLFLLIELGFSADDVAQIVSNHQGLKSKINPGDNVTGDTQSPKRIWYASYGSNLARNRFIAYVQGGTIKGTDRLQEGCKDKTEPARDEQISIPGALYFAEKSIRWGGGISFLGTRPTESKVWGRIYLITEGQFVDIIKQENGMAVASALTLPSLEKLSREKSTTITIGGPYKRLVFLGLKDSIPIFTLTSTDEHAAGVPTAPSQAYLETIVGGLCETYPELDEASISSYLLSASGVQLVPKDEVLRCVRVAYARLRNPIATPAASNGKKE